MCIGFDLTISIAQYFNLCSSSLPDFKSILNCSAAKLGNELESSSLGSPIDSKREKGLEMALQLGVFRRK